VSAQSVNLKPQSILLLEFLFYTNSCSSRNQQNRTLLTTESLQSLRLP